MMPRIARSLLLVCCFVLLGSMPARADKLMGRTTGHYMPGPNGVEGAVNPPNGSDYLAIALANYSFNTMRNNSGSEVTSPSVSMSVTTWRWIHMFEQGLFGGSTGFNVAVTGAYFDARGSALPKNQYAGQIGDPNIEFMQGWMFDNLAIRFRLGTYLGIGAFNKQDAINYSKGFSSFYGQLGTTVWLDPGHRLSLTAIGTYETNTKTRDWDVRPGDDFTLEASVAYRINDYISLALSGYLQTQTTSDSGSDVGWDRNHKYQVTALGPYARIMLPFIKPGTMLHVTLWKEVNARNHSEGLLFFSEFQIPF